MLARPVHPTGHAEGRTGARPGTAGAGVGAHHPRRPGAARRAARPRRGRGHGPPGVARGRQRAHAAGAPARPGRLDRSAGRPCHARAGARPRALARRLDPLAARRLPGRRRGRWAGDLHAARRAAPKYARRRHPPGSARGDPRARHGPAPGDRAGRRGDARRARRRPPSGPADPAPYPACRGRRTGAARAFNPLGADHHELVQADAEPAQLDGERAGRHGDGWARAIGDETALTVVARYFWQEYPKAIEVAADRLRVDLFAGRDAPVLLGTGAAKTHELWLVLEPLDRSTAPAALAAALRAPLLALPPADWIVASHAFPQALTPAARGTRDFLARLAAAVTRYQANARTERWDDGPPVP